MWTSMLVLSVLLTTCSQLKAQNNNNPIGAAQAWWHAVTFADTAYVKNHSTEQLTVTFNNGRSFTRSELITQIATHNPLAKISIEWSDIKEQSLTPQTAVVTNRIVEKVGAMSHIYKFLTIMVKGGAGWKIAAVQSTRVLALAPRITITEVGKLEGFTGEYRTPNGATLKIIKKDSSLVMVDPSGVENQLEPIAADIFELSYLPFAGNVRFAFGRDNTGKVTSLTRLAHVVTAMRRIGN